MASPSPQSLANLLRINIIPRSYSNRRSLVELLWVECINPKCGFLLRRWAWLIRQWTRGFGRRVRCWRKTPSKIQKEERAKQRIHLLPIQQIPPIWAQVNLLASRRVPFPGRELAGWSPMAHSLVPYDELAPTGTITFHSRAERARSG